MWKRGIIFRHRTSAAFVRLAFAAALAGTAALSPAVAGGSQSYLSFTQNVDAPEGFAGVCARYTWACAQSGRGTPSAGAAIAVAQRVNSSVNRTTREIADSVQYGREEYWALPTGRGGDCEDFALAKKRDLIGQGIAPERLLIATVLDRARKPHAVLVLRTDAGDFVLDNLTDRILGWRETGYTFLRMQNPDAPGRWSAILAGGILGS